MYGEEIDRLFEIADHRLDTKTEATEIGQSENTINVPKCISAIELRHLWKATEKQFGTSSRMYSVRKEKCWDY